MSAKKPRAPKPKKVNPVVRLYRMATAVLFVAAAAVLVVLKWPLQQLARAWVWMPYKPVMIMLMAILALGGVSYKLMQHRDAVNWNLAFNEGYEEGRKKSTVIVRTVPVERPPVVEAQPAAPAVAPAPEAKKPKPKPAVAKEKSFGDNVKEFFRL